MSDSEQQETETTVSQPQWPENGGQWSDEEGGAGMDECGLAEMAEEDEEIDIYNDETFGMDMDTGVGETEGDPTNPLLQFGAQPPAPPALPSLSPSSPSFSPRARPQLRVQGPPGLRGRGRGQRGGQAMAQMFEDPAVVRTVEGRPSLQSLDSAIVDVGSVSYWDDPDAWMLQSYEKTRHTSGSVLQDPAIVCVMDSHAPGRGPNYLDSHYPFSNSSGRRGGPRGSYLNRPFGQRCPSQINTMMPSSPIVSQRPFTPQQHYNQTGGFLSPSPRPCPSTPQPLTPKMMQLRFGANSPRPSPFYSPSSNRVQRFRFPGPVTQLHPQHRRLLSQRQPRSQRKPDSWDPYCNLMSAKEKEWIIRLQMIQLQSENPHLDDYYYQEYYRRMEAKLAEEELGMRGKREPPKLTTPYVTKMDSYTPVVHIEGSLGQVAVSTCFSPRRAINAVAAHCPHEELKDIRQQRLDILKKIEKLFMVLLEVEEGQRMKAQVLGEGEEKRLMEKTGIKVEYIYSQLQHPDLEAGEEFLPCLLVSKGKRLLARLLPFLSHDAALKVLSMVTSHLPVLMSRDSDESLPVLYPSLRTVIGGMTFSQLIGVLKDFTASLPDSSDSSMCLSLVCQSKFGLSLLYALLSQGERLLSSDIPLEPSIGDFETWTDTVFLVASQLSQSALVEPLLLPSNLLTLFCRYLDKRTVHQLKSNMESATGYLALPS
ncbi:protein PAT1 homolog 2 isoform X1 [Coregonus clupeaformis]|uniref:protein PAT1 homolog 2 isoform X1 n=1 Tax=Coregonus clupeaformis TaxID=59861 RepID=UPI001BE0EE40|nr:protein PAT1 homolog 2 isoform X1 [Coregonus clupeaformis]